MEPNIRTISFNIYADSDEEAELGRSAIIRFINLVGQQGARVSGDAIAEAVAMFGRNTFISNQIINFFKKQNHG